jgi:hypothetical protein
VQQLYHLGTSNVAHSNVGNGNGLVGWWTFDGPATHWNTNRTDDVSGNGNTGHLISMSTTTSPTQGKIGQALTFNGSNYVVDTNIVNVPHVTVSAWVKIKGAPSQNGLISGFVNGLDAVECDKDLTIGTDGKLYFYVYDGSSESTSAPATALPLNTWVHVVGTADGTTARSYVNGVQVGSVAAGETFASYDVPNVFINGGTALQVNICGALMADYVDDVRIYNRALGAGEIQQLYTAGR